MNLIKQLFGYKKLPDKPDKDEVAKMSKLLTNVFSLAELRNLCFDIGVEYDWLPGDSKAAKAEELVLYFTRSPRSLDEFIQSCSQLHPDIPWDNPDSIESQPPNRARARSILQLINYCFNVNELRDLCLNLGINYDDLPGANKRGKILELVKHYSRFPRNLDQLKQACAKLRPNAPWDTQKITKYEPYNRRALLNLRWALLEHLDEKGVQKLGDKLRVDYKIMPRLDEGGTARELVLYLARRERLDELVEACAYQFPEFAWQEVFDLSEEQRSDEEMHEPVEAMRLRQNLSSFSENNLRDICFEMGIDYDNIAGLNQVGELVSYCDRQERISELVTISKRLHPELHWQRK